MAFKARPVRARSPIRERVETRDIFRVNVDGTGIQQLTSFKLNASDPDWSPDGSKIVFDSGDAGRKGSKGDIYVMAADGSAQTPLTDTPLLPNNFESKFNLANNPVWSPSGTRIMYTQFKPRRTQLVVMDADGSAKRVLISRNKLVNKVDWGVHP